MIFRWGWWAASSLCNLTSIVKQIYKRMITCHCRYSPWRIRPIRESPTWKNITSSFHESQGLAWFYTRVRHLDLSNWRFTSSKWFANHSDVLDSLFQFQKKPKQHPNAISLAILPARCPPILSKKNHRFPSLIFIDFSLVIVLFYLWRLR